MSASRSRQLKLSVWHALSLACLSACATGVQQGFDDDEGSASSSAGSSTGGALMIPSGAGTSSVLPKAGSGSGGNGGSGGKVSNPFGGSSSSGGDAGGSDRGDAGSGGAAGGSGGGSGGGGSGGSGSGPCGCAKTLTWTDNTNMNWVTGDCLTAAGTTYKYTGTKAQDYANVQCNPGKQEAWCTDSGNDYKFMVCP